MVLFLAGMICVAVNSYWGIMNQDNGDLIFFWGYF